MDRFDHQLFTFFSLKCLFSVQENAISVINNVNANSTDKANALSLYIQSTTNLNGSSTANGTLSVSQIEGTVDSLGNITLTVSSSASFLMVQEVNQSANVVVLGASFQRGSGGGIVSSTNINNVTNSTISAAAFVNNQSLSGVTSLNMLIIDKPTMYQNADNSTDNKSLASSVIVAAVQPNSSVTHAINISLYFGVLPEYQVNVNATYVCSFYDTSNSRWNGSGCTQPQYNEQYNRYECNCNHLTTFALIKSSNTPPSNTPQPNYLTRQVITSLVFLSIFIFCFIVVIIHSLTTRLINRMMSFGARDLLPLISTGCTTILFILYIALTMIVYRVRRGDLALKIEFLSYNA
jgi:hypothetical protein